MENKSILVVEDDRDARNTFSLLLGIEGYKVLEAENGMKAIETLLSLPETELPDCILLDLMMPVMDGRTLLNFINNHKTDRRFNKIPVVVATANPELVDSQVTAFSEAQLVKPIDLDELCDVVGQFCKKS